MPDTKVVDYDHTLQTCVDCTNEVIKIFKEVKTWSPEDQERFYGDWLNGLVDIPLIPESVEQPLFKWLVGKVKGMISGIF